MTSKVNEKKYITAAKKVNKRIRIVVSCALPVTKQNVDGVETVAGSRPVAATRLTAHDWTHFVLLNWLPLSSTLQRTNTPTQQITLPVPHKSSSQS